MPLLILQTYTPFGLACKRTGHTHAVCYQLYGFPPGFERKKKNPNNTYQGRGRSSNDRRSYPSANNAISDTDHSDFNRVENPRNQGYGRGDRQSDSVEYHKGLNALQEQYNQILQMLGQSNRQSTTERDSTSHSSANLAQENYPSSGNVTALSSSIAHT